MKHRASGYAALSAGLLCGVFAACAGEEFPSINSRLADDIEAAYADGAVAQAGSAGAGSNDDPGEGGAAGSGGSANASAGAAGAGGDGGAAGSMAAAAGAAGGGAEAGAAGSGPVGGGSTGDVCDGFAILAANCSTGGCHGQGSNLGDFAASEEAALSYVGESGVICGGQGPIIDPENPADSVLILKLSDDPPCGQPMPQNGPLLSDDDVACLEEWIASLE